MELRNKFENSPAFPNLSNVNPHTVAYLFLEFLQTLPDPLLTCEASPKLIVAAANNSNAEVFQEIVDSLPKIHLILFCYLLEFLRSLIEDSQVTLVNSVMLASIFGPILVCESQNMIISSRASFGTIVETDCLKATALLVLINHYQIPSFYFEEKEKPIPILTPITKTLTNEISDGEAESIEETSSLHSFQHEDSTNTPQLQKIQEKIDFSKDLISPKIQDYKKLQILHLTTSDMGVSWTNKETKSNFSHFFLTTKIFFFFLFKKKNKLSSLLRENECKLV